MIDNTLLTDIFNLKELKSKAEAELNVVKAKINAIDAELSFKSGLLLEELTTNNMTTYNPENTDLIALKCSQKSFEYYDESKCILALNNAGYSNLVKVKSTSSLDKNAIKKAVKSDNALLDLINAHSGEKITEYVIVTTLENYQKMQERSDSNE